MLIVINSYIIWADHTLWEKVWQRNERFEERIGNGSFFVDFFRVISFFWHTFYVRTSIKYLWKFSTRDWTQILLKYIHKSFYVSLSLNRLLKCQGLTEEEARIRLAKFGPNALTPPPTTPEWLKFAKNLFAGFATLLWIGAFLCFFAFGVDFVTSEECPKDNVGLSKTLRFSC